MELDRRARGGSTGAPSTTRARSIVDADCHDRFISWLNLTRRGAVRPIDRNFRFIFRHDPRLRGAFALNEKDRRVYVVRDLPLDGLAGDDDPLGPELRRRLQRRDVDRIRALLAAPTAVGGFGLDVPEREVEKHIRMEAELYAFPGEPPRPVRRGSK